LDPCFLRQQVKYVSNIRLDPFEAYRDDIWAHPQLSSWIGAGKSSILLLQGSHDSRGRSGIFGAELADHIADKKNHVAYMVYKPTLPGSCLPPFPIEEAEVLRHLAIQALQTVADCTSVQVLTDLVESFSQAKTCADWFRVICAVFYLVSELYVIIDLGIHASSADAAKAWPSKFHAILEDVGAISPETIIRVLIISCRPLDVPQNSVNVSKITLRKPNVHPDLVRNRHSKQARIPPSLWESYQPPKPRANKVETLKSHDESLAPVDIHSPNGLANGSSVQNNHTDMSITVSVAKGCINKPAHAREFTTAIFCALPIEADAVLALFDFHWNQHDYPKAPGDNNCYSVGAIGRQNVVLVHISSMGKSKAATASSQCRATFTSIKLSLLVGICGGVPGEPGSEGERLLGDVVISEGLVQYDFGRQYPGFFERKSTVQESLSKLDAAVGGFLARLRTSRYSALLLQNTLDYLSVLQSHPDQKGRLQYAHPGIENDCLYQPSYLHKHHEKSQCSSWEDGCGTLGGVCKAAMDSPCDSLGCENHQIVQRRRTQNHEKQSGGRNLAIHVGILASGDKVIKSGEERDRVALEEDVIAFEMEGAGLWDHGPCMVIKSICDYADCHKSKRWQSYAAATAAACTKGILEQWN
jgi:nucleoside phosphorylase